MGHVGFSPTRQTLLAPSASTVKCSASRMKGELRRSKNLFWGGLGRLVRTLLHLDDSVDYLGGGGGYSVFAWLSHFTIDRASLSSRSTAPTPNRDTSNVRVLSTIISCIILNKNTYYFFLASSVCGRHLCSRIAIVSSLRCTAPNSPCHMRLFSSYLNTFRSSLYSSHSFSDYMGSTLVCIATRAALCVDCFLQATTGIPLFSFWHTQPSKCCRVVRTQDVSGLGGTSSRFFASSRRVIVS